MALANSNKLSFYILYYLQYRSFLTLQIHACRKRLHAILIGMLPSSLLVLASFCLVHALQMLATRADLLLHVAFIVMLPSSLLVLASFYPVHALQMLANYV